ncbi:MAG: hypothetical protein DWQ08_03065 [Proteobacteria bacterium]|nr:MAG: hypothetical protein DWQ08_03065 [Pseudomonadota bacterium]
MSIVCATCAAGAATWQNAAAATRLEYLTEADPETGERMTLEVIISDGQLLLKGDTADGLEHRVWYDDKTSIVTVLNPYEGGYYRLNPRIAKDAKHRLAAFRNKVEERIEGYDKSEIQDALALVAHLENQEFGGSFAGTLEYRRNGSANYNGRQCMLADVYIVGDEGAVHDRETCLAPVAEIVEQAEDARTLANFGEASRTIAESVVKFAAVMPRYGSDLSEGVPVAITFLSSDSVVQFVLETAESSASGERIVDDDTFEIPGEYDRELPLMNRGLKSR